MYHPSKTLTLTCTEHLRLCCTSFHEEVLSLVHDNIPVDSFAGVRELTFSRSSDSPSVVPDFLPVQHNMGVQEHFSIPVAVQDLPGVYRTQHCFNLHECVRASGVPNYQSCRKAVLSRLNITKW